MDIEINKNGETYRLEDYGIHVKDFIVSSIPLEPQNGVIEGRAGTVDYGAYFGSRTITAPFIMQSNDLMDFPLLRDFLFSIVVSREPFYIRERRRGKYQAHDFVDTNEKAKDDEESQNSFVSGKRYKVRLKDSFDIDQSLEYGEGEFIFETTDLPFAESIGTTQDIQNSTNQYADSIFPTDSEEWERGGISVSGSNFSRSTSLRVKGYIPVEPETEYYFKVESGKEMYIREYDYSQKFVETPSRKVEEGGERLIKTNRKTYYVRVYFNTDSDTEPEFIGSQLMAYIEEVNDKPYGLSTEKEMWAFGMGLMSEDETFQYTKKLNTDEVFRVYNAGKLSVHPFEQELTIEVEGINGSSSFFEIVNLTNGTHIKINRKLDVDKKLKIEGANITINNIQSLRDSNRQFIELEPGINEIIIDGAKEATLMFDFRFYYL